jgi:hypothetical protein
MLEPNEEDDEANTLKNWVEQGAAGVHLVVATSYVTRTKHAAKVCRQTCKAGATVHQVTSLQAPLPSCQGAAGTCRLHV